MKSIRDTLNIVKKIVKLLSDHDKVSIALAGGYAVVAHGVERTTVDVDFCIYADTIHQKDTKAFIGLLKTILPDNFEIKFMEGTRILDDPFQHDVIFLYDKSGEYPKIDLIVAKYKWELEGTKASRPLEDIPFPVLPKPYLIAMKLKAGGPKDDYDVIELYGLLTKKEKGKTHELAKLIHKDKRLSQLIKPKKILREKEDKAQLL